MDLLNIPVTLVVKAPNQKVADQTVECGLGWTIKKLKEHLSSVYPSQPKESQQKLIYSGQLLKDDLVLKDVLRQHEDGFQHTVHLVCALNGDHMNQTNGQQTQSQNTAATTSSSSSSSSDAASRTTTYAATSPQSSYYNTPSSSQTPPSTSSAMTDGLRHRGSFTMPNAMHAQGLHQMPEVAQASYNQYLAAMMSQYHYNPQQVMMMQHIYAQQVAQYMQYHQQLPTMTPPGTPGVVPAANQNPGFPAAGNRPAGAPGGAPAGPAAGGADQPIRMNAQGGAVMDDDDEEGFNRDWLDWVYTVCRFMVLLSIVYFYSSLGRFVLVLSLFLLVWMYQNGYFQLQRRIPAPRAADQREEQQQAAAPPAGAPEQQPAPQPEGENQQEAPPAENTQDTENTAAPGPIEPPPPGVLAVAWSFIMTFFTSLVPQQPDAVNAN